MKLEIKIEQKPDWVSWSDIKNCLYESHAVNRAKGINMLLYKASPSQLHEYIGANGVMLVALDGKKLVGTGGICERNDKLWCTKGNYLQICLVGILPEYSGHGIFRQLLDNLEKIAVNRKSPIILTTTHEKNKRKIEISITNGYQIIGYSRVEDHYNVVMAKWLYECPYVKFYVNFRVVLSWLNTRTRTLLRKPYYKIKTIICK